MELMIIYDTLKHIDSLMDSPPKQVVIGDLSYLITKLQEFSKSRTQRTNKYPLLFMQEGYKVVDYSGYVEVTLNAAIINDSRNTYSNDERSARITETIKPVYDSLFRAFILHPQIMPEYSYLHDRRDRLDIGRNALLTDNATSPDYIDAIEIRNLKVKIRKFNLI